MERSRGHQGETAQPLRQQPYGPVVQSSPTEHWLWLEGLVSPMAVPLCGFSGEYEMRVVQGRARSRAHSCCPEGEERVPPARPGSDVQVQCRELYPSWAREPFAVPSSLRFSVFLPHVAHT